MHSISKGVESNIIIKLKKKKIFYYNLIINLSIILIRENKKINKNNKKDGY